MLTESSEPITARSQLPPRCYDHPETSVTQLLLKWKSASKGALVHDAYLCLVSQNLPDWESRMHFFGVAAHLIRQIPDPGAARFPVGHLNTPGPSAQ